jgi:hypothetical protein
VTVADLQRFLADLARLLGSTDSKKTSAELERVVAGLEPFKAFSIADFAGFLPRAEDYWRTGVLPVVAAKTSSRSKATAQPSVGLSVLREEVVRLYKTAGTADVTSESIAELRPKLKSLKKADLVALAESVELVGMKSKAIAAIVDSIVKRISSIKESAMRASIIDRPGTQY